MPLLTHTRRALLFSPVGGVEAIIAPTFLGPPAVAGSTQLDLSWVDNARNEGGYKIHRSLSATGPWAQIAVTAPNATSYSDTGLTAETTYYYSIQAFKGAIDGAYSAVVSGTTGAAGPGTLGAKFTSFWSLENTSWTDEVSSHTLTPANSPTAVAAKVGNGANLVGASAQQLNVTHADFMPSAGVSFAFCCWWKPAVADASFRGFIGCTVSGGTSGYAVFNTDTLFHWQCRTAGGSVSVQSSGVTPTVGVWYFVVGQFDESADLLRLNINALAQRTTSTGGSALTTPSAVFRVGISNSNDQYSSGVIDQLGWVLGNTLTDAEVAYLYNAGAGRDWASIYAASP